MKQLLKLACVATLTLMFAACSTGPTLKENLMKGQWEGEVQGFPVTLNYTETDIEVVGMGMSMPYELEGNVMSFEVPGQGPVTYEIAIEGDKLIQTDPNSGASSTLERKM